MGNKIWIVLLGFSAFAYAAVCIAGLYFAIASHAHIWSIVKAAIGAGIIWSVMLKALISR
jgi:hypothetical protein